MQNRQNTKIWQAPWGYPESFAVVGGVLIIGMLLQLVVGSFDFYLLAAPSNLFIAGVMTLLSIVIGLGSRTSSFAQWLSGVHITLSLLALLLLLTIIMGLTPQTTKQFSSLGFEMMTSNWAFVMLYGVLVVVLGAVVVRRFRVFKSRDISFMLNHLGLWLLLLASGLGYADMQRYIMYVNEGETEWRVYDMESSVKELPIAITLNDFSVDYYPSRSVIVDVESGEIQHGDSSKYTLGDRYISVMTAPEPRSFVSDVDVYTESGGSISTTIEVNMPLRIGSWTIYQYGYDNQAGNNSKYSSFELVYDSWIIPVYIGVILMMLGAVSMIWSGRKFGA